MQDSELLKGLLEKRENHLSEIKKHQQAVSNIDGLIKLYQTGESEKQYHSPNGNISPKNLTEAILYVMQTQPDKEWRGADVNREMKKLKFGKDMKNLSQKISARLIDRSRGELNNSQWERIVLADFPVYKLRDKYKLSK
ncbi:MAG TPA: hypothetical protein VHP63_01660 [candidate division Zixibacteria bacterium]|nr:hypothetical protein [candidate division Zixibacteria bacterium]